MKFRIGQKVKIREYSIDLENKYIQNISVGWNPDKMEQLCGAIGEISHYESHTNTYRVFGYSWFAEDLIIPNFLCLKESDVQF